MVLLSHVCWPYIASGRILRRLIVWIEKKYKKKYFHLTRWEGRGIHRRNICRPRSCDASGLSTGSQSAVSSSASSPRLIWCPDLSPFLTQKLCQPPNSSRAISGCRRESPAMCNVELFGDTQWKTGRSHSYKCPIVAWSILQLLSQVNSLSFSSILAINFALKQRTKYNLLGFQSWQM